MSDMPLPSWRQSREEAPGVSRRMLLVAGGLLGGVVLLGLIGWGVSKIGSGSVPVVEADPTPLRERPAAPGGLVVPNQDESIFDHPSGRRAETLPPVNRLGGTGEAPQLERLRQQQLQAQQQQAEAVPRAEPPPVAAPAAPVASPPAARAPVAPVARPATVAPATGGRWAVQLGALASEAAARSAWERAARQVPELANRQPAISKLERDGQAPLWRLRAGRLADAAAARALCEAVKAKGVPCMPVAP